MKQFWDRLERRGKVGFVVGIIMLVLLSIFMLLWLLRQDYVVLFSGLAPEDAAAMTVELDKEKVPYQLGGDGSTILVAAERVHKVRLKLVSKNLPRHGVVGFELFNEADFGMTEFAQKVNYQRALQGELSRTILSLDEVAAVRVHLAMPDQSLFRNGNNNAKASITLTLKPQRQLNLAQVQGIQRLVSSAVPNSAPEDITVVDQHGMALSRRADASGAESASAAKLDMKRDIEAYLSRKAIAMLEQAFGEGKALVTVDVDLNYDQVKVTMDDVVPAVPQRAGGKSAGVVVKERKSRDVASTATSATTLEATAPAESEEVEYQVGHRVQQVVSTPGNLEHVRVAVVISKAVDAPTQDQIKALVATAVGVNKARGDEIAIYAVPDMVQKPESPRASPALGDAPPPAKSSNSQDIWLLGGAGGLLLMTLMLLGWWVLRPARVMRSAETMTDAQRTALLRQIEGWLQSETRQAS